MAGMMAPGGLGNVPQYGQRTYVPPQTSLNNPTMPQKKRISKDSTGAWTEDTDYGPSMDEELATRDKWNATAEARRQASLRALMEQYGGGTGGGTGPNPTIAFDEQGARDAAFARAKDKAGQIARSSVNSLRELLGGNLGGAKEAAGLADVAGGAANELGEFNRDQLMLDLNRASDISDRNYAGGLEREKMAQDKFRSLYQLFSEGKGPIY